MKETRDSSTTVLIVIGALLLGVGGAWLFLTNRAPVDEPPPLAQAEKVPEADELSPFDALPAYDVQQSLEMAELALLAGQIEQPEDGSAILFLRRVLAVEPDHVRANEAMRVILDDLSAKGQRALAAENYARLSELLDIFDAGEESVDRYNELRDAVSELIAAKLNVVDVATRRGQLVPAAALLSEIETIPTADQAALATRRAALDALQVAAVQQASAPELTDETIDQTDDPALLSAEDPTGFDVAPAPAEEGTSDNVALIVAAETESGGVPSTQDGDLVDELDGDVLADEAEAASAVVEEEDPVMTMLASAVDNLAQGRLVMPVGDNARYYFSEARRLDPTNALAINGLRDVMVGLNRRALDAANNGQWDEADRWLRQSESVDSNLDLVDQTRQQVVTMRIAAETNRLIPVSELTTRKIVRPRFPNRALRNEVGGWALLRFTVETDGTTKDIEIVETSDRFGSQFGHAAESAVEKWKFEPREFMGQTIAARTQTRVNFALAD